MQGSDAYYRYFTYYMLHLGQIPNTATILKLYHGDKPFILHLNRKVNGQMMPLLQGNLPSLTLNCVALKFKQAC